jgi:hypothetical protein
MSQLQTRAVQDWPTTGQDMTMSSRSPKSTRRTTTEPIELRPHRCEGHRKKAERRFVCRTATLRASRRHIETNASTHGRHSCAERTQDKQMRHRRDSRWSSSLRKMRSIELADNQGRTSGGGVKANTSTLRRGSCDDRT